MVVQVELSEEDFAQIKTGLNLAEMMADAIADATVPVAGFKAEILAGIGVETGKQLVKQALEAADRAKLAVRGR
jgi:hypothetical protein